MGLQLPFEELPLGGKTKRRVLLVEPGYTAKYPPLGLMKIARYHQDDEVVFFKGNSAAIRDQKWDLIYVTSMFTFQWKTTIETIQFYQRGKQKNKYNLLVGGIAASILAQDMEKETGVKPHVGLWEEVDKCRPDYTLFEKWYPSVAGSASLAYTTRGCVNRCGFCAVHKLEPEYQEYLSLDAQIDSSKQNLILLDNNVLASPRFKDIVSDIKRNGFQKGARWKNKWRYVDFNQGIDARLLNEENMQLLSELAIKPLRIAFDHISLKNLYVEKVKLARKHGIQHLSNYILFNFQDTPDDFYKRLQINIELNEELDLDIFSFPMRYIPLDAKDRKYVGPNWTSTQLRGIQCILHATHGVVGPKRAFFEKAFGQNVDQFKFIIEQPEPIIFDRSQLVFPEPVLA